MVEYHYVELKKAIPAGANNIGTVNVAGLPAFVSYDTGRTALPVIALRDLAAIFQDHFFRWINDYTCSGASEIITDANLYMNTANGVVFYVTAIDLEILTNNKYCYFEFGTCSGLGATGIFTPRTPRYYLDRGAASCFGTFVHRDWTIPIDVRYHVAECRSMTMRIQGQDNATHVLMSFRGFWID